MDILISKSVRERRMAGKARRRRNAAPFCVENKGNMCYNVKKMDTEVI